MWSDWLKIIQLKPRFLFGLGLLGVLLLFLPSSLVGSFGIISVRDSYRGWIGTATLAAFAFWGVQLLPSLKAWLHERKRKSEILMSLDALSKEEQFLLAYCLDRNQRTVCLPMIDRAATSLCQKGLLVSANRFADSLAWPFTIPNFVWEHLQLISPQILPEEERVNPEVRRRFDEFERFLHRHDRGPSLRF
jgi:hypothetical protein